MTARRGVRLLAVAGLVVGLAASAAPSSVAAGLGDYPGALPDTASAFDTKGQGDFSDLSIHVNQTTDLTTQAVSVTWSWPGHATQQGYSESTGDLAYAVNTLKIMQCWGDPVTSKGDDAATAANFVEGNPGPAREHCVYGGSLTPSPGITALNQANRTAISYATSPTRYGTESVYQATPGRSVDVPFVAANGTQVPHQSEPISDTNPTKVYSNPYFDKFSSNELPANYTFGSNSRGGVQFQVQNSADARGTGCGAPRTGGTGLNRCWLVVVPQGDKDLDGNPFKLGRSNSYRDSAYGSPLVSTTWRNRIAIPLDFLPTVSACAVQGDTYETVGSALVANAALSWQSKLCGSTGLIYNYTPGTDDLSRDALSSGSQSLQFTSDPAPPDSLSTPVTYAPLTLSGVGIAFAWDAATRNTRTSVTTPGQPLPTIKLNQRLVAKLLTYSYQGGNPTRIGENGAERKPGPEAYAWLTRNPEWIGSDPEFLALNPEVATIAQLNKFTVLLQTTPAISAVQGPANSSDAVGRLWQWVASDAKARAFLAGASDDWGMTVDPYYSTNADVNPTGVAFSTDGRDDLPYADPWSGVPGSAKKLCDDQPALQMGDIWPAAKDMATVAKDVLTVNPLEKYTGGYTCIAQSSDINPPGWKTSRSGTVISGYRQLMGLTDTASGAQYGVTFAALQNAGGAFVGPTGEAIAAAATHLVDTGVQGVRQPDLTTTDKTAYPLSLIGYAGATTSGMSSDTCAAFASLLDYASGAGQEQGTSIGELPPGYVPLTAALRQQSSTAARTVAACAQDAVPADDAGDVAPAVAPAAVAPLADVPTAVTAAGDPVAAAAAAAQAPGVSLAAASRTKPDPNVFAYVVPIAVLVGLLSLLAAPLAGLRRRRTGGASGPAPGS